MRTILDSIIIARSRVSSKKFLFKERNSIKLLLTTKNSKITRSLNKRMNQIIWSLRLRTLKRINLSFKISKISRIFMLKQLLNNSNSTKNLLQITTISDGFGCNFHGFVWLWNAITPKNSENVLLLQLPTCQSHNKDNLQFKPLK